MRGLMMEYGHRRHWYAGTKVYYYKWSKAFLEADENGLFLPASAQEPTGWNNTPIASLADGASAADGCTSYL